MRFETLAVHAGGEADRETGAVVPPIHLSTTFLHGPESEPLHGWLYQREGNPTQDRLEAALAAIEGGGPSSCALAFASGMAAAATLLQSLPAGARVLFHSDIYSGVRQLALDFLPRWGMEAVFANLADERAVGAALASGAALVWAETPTNPQLEILDLARLADAAHAAGAGLLVDGTFATPALQRPLALGADVVLHSTTKYLSGHSDVLGGALVFARADDLSATAERVRRRLGGTASPFNSWLVLRGLRSLSCRVERHSANALALATALSGHPALSHVLYPGLPTHPGHQVAARQMAAFGGMLALRVAGGRAAAVAVAARLGLFLNATSLGGPESLVEHRASSDGPGTTTPDDLLRLSIGLEHPDDLLADLLQALEPSPARAPG
ncbi:MAG: cystathionine gamma-synthase [Acidobacteriota bacterium]|nr:cystathionine gamma-synthase [Acidobacteriota bacterium]